MKKKSPTLIKVCDREKKKSITQKKKKEEATNGSPGTLPGLPLPDFGGKKIYKTSQAWLTRSYGCQ